MGRESRKRLPVTRATCTSRSRALSIAIRLRSEIWPRESSRVPSRSRASRLIGIRRQGTQKAQKAQNHSEKLLWFLCFFVAGIGGIMRAPTTTESWRKKECED